ncbi:hypothetical protein MMC34_008518, partial [Xylographa carneopallida]|nr:hypothetical protein [Xylographa carneopallida]
MALAKLVLLCAFMFGVSMAVGCLPLVFSFSHRHLRTLTTFGVGLLIGTAFIVIIPEGIHTLYTPPSSSLQRQQAAHSHSGSSVGVLDADYWQQWWRGSPSSHSHSLDAVDSHALPDVASPQHDMTVNALSAAESSHAHSHSQSEQATAEDPSAMVRILPASPAAGGRSLLQHSHAAHGFEQPGEEGEHEGEDECVFEPEGSGYIGASLALGFVVMLLVDRIGGGHSHGPLSNQQSDAPHAAYPQESTQRASPASGKRMAAGIVRRQSDRDRQTDEDEDVDDIVQRTSVIHIAAANSRPTAAAAAASSSTALTGAQQTQELGRERELSAEERDKERERQRVEREKERERAHGYAPYASGLLPSASDSATSLAASVASSNATIGILVHSFVDGIALGAISLSSDSSLELVVFLAILLHKGPAALGLVSFLMYQGRSQLYIRTQLTLFSLCAPIAA